MKFSKKCVHCGKDFSTPQARTKYCPDCKKKIQIERSKKHREETKYLKVENIAELQEKEPFKKIVNHYTKKFHEEYPSSSQPHFYKMFMRSPGLKWSELFKVSGLSRSHFSTFLRTCQKLEAMTCNEGKYYLTPKCVYEPLRVRHRRTINETPAEHIYLGEHFVFYPPKNIVSDDFEKEDMIQINKIQEDFLVSMKKLLEKIRDKKAKEIWTKEINDNDYVNPLVKLDMWTCLFMGTICTHSSKIFLSFDTKILDTKKGRMPREKAIDMWRKQEEYFRQEIFNDILNNLWSSKTLSEEDVKQINLQFKKQYREGYSYCKEVWKKIVNTLRPRNYTFIISPFIEHGFGYGSKGKDEKDENIEYLKSLPWFEYKFKANDKLMDALNYVNSVERQHGLIGRKEVETAGIKTKWEYKKTEKKEHICLPLDDTPYDIGETWFNHFNSDLRNKLLEFCVDLGYKSGKQFEVVGKFVSIFHLPYIPNPQEMLKNSRGNISSHPLDRKRKNERN